MTGILRNSAKRALGRVGETLLPERFFNRVIYYHSVHPELPGGVRPAVFRAQLSWLRDCGVRTVLVRDIPRLSLIGNGDKWVAISFDDGYRDNAEYALPILREEGCVATFFVVAGMVADRTPKASDEGYMLYPARRMLVRSDLVALAKAGMEIGSHSLTHRLACDVEAERAGAFEEELRQSLVSLQDAIGSAVLSFSYPNGQRGAFSSATHAALSAVGLSVGATTMWGHLEGASDALELPRCEIAATDSVAEFRAKMLGQRDYLRLIHQIRFGSRVWRSREAFGGRSS